MKTETESITPTPVRPPDNTGRARRSSFWPGIGLATVGLVAGLALGISSYFSAQDEIDSFARMSVPGSVIVQVAEPGAQVVYFEGDESVIEGLMVVVADPDGDSVPVTQYEAEVIYETAGVNLGRAIASFDAERIGAYYVEASGTDTGQITVGDSVARLVLPGVLAGLAIAGLSLLGGLTLWLVSVVRR